MPDETQAERPMADKHPADRPMSKRELKLEEAVNLPSGLSGPNFSPAEIIRELLINRSCQCGGWSCPRCSVTVAEAERLVPDLRDNIDRRWEGEVCKRCHRRNCIGFSVPDAAWSAVTRDRWNVLCPTCFDEEAEAAGVPYSFGEVWPVTWRNPPPVEPQEVVEGPLCESCGKPADGRSLDDIPLCSTCGEGLEAEDRGRPREEWCDCGHLVADHDLRPGGGGRCTGGSDIGGCPCSLSKPEAGEGGGR